MRIPAIVLVCCGALSGAPAAFPGECDSCKDLPKTKDIGECRVCGGMTTSGSFQICMGCSRRLGECQRCQKAMAPPPAETIDESRDGKYASGPWEYVYSITGKDTRSEGRHGRLLHAGRPVAEPASVNDHHRTPWGSLYWVGRPAVPFGGHGWMPRPLASRPVGHLLPEPEPPELMVWVKVLAAGAPGETPVEEPWIREALEREEVREARVEKDWFSLGSESAILHDTKMYGRASIRLCPSGEGEPLAVTTWSFDREGTRTEIPRKYGATKLLKHRVSSCVEVLDLYLAVRVGPEPAPAPKETSWVDDLLEEPAGPAREE